MTDWERIKRDYVSDATTTYRSLGEKYGVSFREIGRVAKAGDWIGQRRQFLDRLSTQTMENAIEIATEGITECSRVAKKLLRRISQRVDDETREISSYEYRQISGAIRDIKQIMTSGETADNTIQIIMGEAEEFINGSRT